MLENKIPNDFEMKPYVNFITKKYNKNKYDISSKTFITKKFYTFHITKKNYLKFRFKNFLYYTILFSLLFIFIFVFSLFLKDKIDYQADVYDRIIIVSLFLFFIFVCLLIVLYSVFVNYFFYKSLEIYINSDEYKQICKKYTDILSFKNFFVSKKAFKEVIILYKMKYINNEQYKIAREYFYERHKK